MITCVFTIDYEIYGNGEGTLTDLVYEPAAKFEALFRKWGLRFVAFVEVAELEMIEVHGADRATDTVKHQLRDLYREGFELGLHLHPQWYNARYQNGDWSLDYGEYNLCLLPEDRIAHIVDRSIAYFRRVLSVPDFTPFSFRAGNWLFQPTRTAARVLAARGIRVDSSVFKGGLRHEYNLDYRPALGNGYYWKFSDNVDTPDPDGDLLELPIYTRMVPIWNLLTAKRIGLERRSLSATPTARQRLHRVMDVARLRHPLKLDFCRMDINGLTRLIDDVVRDDREDPSLFRPIVAIGHTKELFDLATVELLLSYLEKNKIAVSTFTDIYPRCR